jgi:DNA polymerase-3 subunit beta
VKVTGPASAINAALSLAAMAADRKADTPVRASADNGTVSFTCVNPKMAISITATAPATVIESGQGAVSASRLAALHSGLAPGAPVTLTIMPNAMIIACGGSQYRLPLLPDPPAGLVIDPEIGRIKLSGKDCIALLEEVLPAAGTERSRFMLTGIYWHNVDGRLVSVAADGTVLLRNSVPAEHLSSDRTLVIPAQAAAILIKLLRQIKPEWVMVRRSHAVFGASAPGFDFITGLIGTPYPDYQRVVPGASSNIARCSRQELIGALARLDAIANVEMPLIALSWAAHRSETVEKKSDGLIKPSPTISLGAAACDGGSLRLLLPRQPDDGTDIIAAETKGAAQIALSLSRLAAMVSEFSERIIHLEADIGQGLTIRQGDKLGVLASCQWNFGTEKRPALAR